MTPHSDPDFGFTAASHPHLTDAQRAALNASLQEPACRVCGDEGWIGQWMGQEDPCPRCNPDGRDPR